HGDVLMWLMKTLLTSRCVNQRGAGQQSRIVLLYKMPKYWIVRCSRPDSKKNLHNHLALCSVGFGTTLPEKKI
ncbi:hypothetical protein EHJ16_22860, partial [Cronobacter dublinensis]|nr:hypothetical protein [Cronobacter dublinensis]